MGVINERESAFRDAAENYQRAWEYGNMNNPNIGNFLNYF